MTEDEPKKTQLDSGADRRSVLKLISAASVWPAIAPATVAPQTLAAQPVAAQGDISSFKIHVSDDDLADLRHRLTNIRWPPEATGEPWAMGTDLTYLKELVAYWRDKYKWRVHEAAMNTFDHYVTIIEGQKIHFIHQKSGNPSAIPLLMTHGWPGSFWEMLPTIQPLANPTANGGTATDAFDVVVPSIPGFGYSGMGLEGTTPERVGELWVALMEKLGYKRFGAYGTDWGVDITLPLGNRFPDRMIGTCIAGQPPRSNRAPRTPEERAHLVNEARWSAQERAYMFMHGSKPQTMAYGLTDSPTGLAGWIVEKLRSWSDCHGNLESRFTKDQILTLLSMFWHTRSISTSARFYYYSGRWRTPPGAPRVSSGEFGRGATPSGTVPKGYFDFPGQRDLRVPRSYVDDVPKIVTYWESHDTGGHFPGVEEPKLLVDDMRAFFRPLRS